jgi:hypothetical protein
VRNIQKRGPATQNSSLAKGFDDDIPLMFSQIYGSFKMDTALDNDIKMLSVISLLKKIFTTSIRIHLAKTGDFGYLTFSQHPKKLATL